MGSSNPFLVCRRVLGVVDPVYVTTSWSVDDALEIAKARNDRFDVCPVEFCALNSVGQSPIELLLCRVDSQAACAAGQSGHDAPNVRPVEVRPLGFIGHGSIGLAASGRLRHLESEVEPNGIRLQRDVRWPLVEQLRCRPETRQLAAGP